MAHQNNKKCIRVFIGDEMTPIRYEGVDATEVTDGGVFFTLCWHSPYQKIKIPISRIFTVSEEYEQAE